MNSGGGGSSTVIDDSGQEPDRNSIGIDSAKKKLNEALAECKALELKRYESWLYEYGLLR